MLKQSSRQEIPKDEADFRGQNPGKHVCILCRKEELWPTPSHLEVNQARKGFGLGVHGFATRWIRAASGRIAWELVVRKPAGASVTSCTLCVSVRVQFRL